MTLSKIASCAVVTLALTICASAQTPFSTPVRDVENPAKSPYWSLATLDILNGFQGAVSFDPVPVGKRLVIEFASFVCTTEPNTNGVVDVSIARLTVPAKNAATASIQFSHSLVVSRQGKSFSGDTYAAAQSLRLYSEAGTPGASVSLSGNTPHLGCNIAISGYLVNVP